MACPAHWTLTFCQNSIYWCYRVPSSELQYNAWKGIVRKTIILFQVVLSISFQLSLVWVPPSVRSHLRYFKPGDKLVLQLRIQLFWGTKPGIRSLWCKSQSQIGCYPEGALFVLSRVLSWIKHQIWKIPLRLGQRFFFTVNGIIHQGKRFPLVKEKEAKYQPFCQMLNFQLKV